MNAATLANLDLLPVFLAVAESRSFSGAARKLGRPKSSVSRAIAQLERDLGTPIIHRTTRRVALSTAGEALLARVGPPMAALAQALASMPEQDAVPSGELRMTAPNDFGVGLLGEVIARFREAFPAIAVDVRFSFEAVDLVEGGFDLGLRVATRIKDASLVARKITAVGLVLVASPSYLARRGTPRLVSELPAHDWVIFPRVHKTLDLIGPDGPERVDVTASARVYGDDFSFLREAAKAGAGLAAVPRFLVAHELAQGTLVRLLPRHEMPAGTLFLVYPPGRPIPRKVAAFRDFALARLADRPW